MSNIKSDVENICLSLTQLIENNSEIIKYSANRLNEEVLALLNGNKPRIMVYGIYNAGKSTLINAIMQKEVAEVRDCPTTYKIDEYDHGDYILIDSPGVDAPQEHQKVTEEYISKCHVILYVISTKGGFESIENYQNMYRLMRMGKPFIIVINDSLGEPDLNQSTEISKIKCKIIENLRKISGNSGIENMFDTISVNGKRGFDAIIKGKKLLYKKSNVEFLKDRILYFLHSGQAMRIFIAPVNNLIAFIDEIQEQIQNQIAPDKVEELSVYRKLLNQKRHDFITELPFRLDSVVSRYENSLIQTAYQKQESQWEQIFSQMYDEVDAVCRSYIEELTAYLKLKFDDIDFSNILSGFSAEADRDFDDVPDVPLNESHTENSSETPMEDYETKENKSGAVGVAATAVALAASAATGTIVPLAAEEIIKGVFGFLKNGAESKRKKELQEFHQMQAEIQRNNLEAEARANAEAKRRQEIRIHVETQLHQIRTNLCTGTTKQFVRLFDNAESCILHTIDKNHQQNVELDKLIKELNRLKEQAETVKSNIGIT